MTSILYRKELLPAWPGLYKAYHVAPNYGHSSSVSSVCYSPDGKYIASGSYDKTIKVWEAASGHLVNTLIGHSSSVESVCYSPDGKYIALGSYDKTIKVWEA
ncbi:MAG: WD40 repeat domain-containing protein, partial [Promethearchaeota archaeon]